MNYTQKELLNILKDLVKNDWQLNVNLKKELLLFFEKEERRINSKNEKRDRINNELKEILYIFLCKNKEKKFTAKEIYDNVWEYDIGFTSLSKVIVLLRSLYEEGKIKKIRLDEKQKRFSYYVGDE